MRLLVIAIVLGVLGGLGACWRGAVPPDAPAPSFIERRNALVELNRSADAVVPQLQYAMQRIIGLASEAERDAIRSDLVVLERDIARLSNYVIDRRARGDNAATLDEIERKLEQAALAVMQLREELIYAKTTAELAALDELSRDREAMRVEQREQLLVRLRAMSEQAQTEPVEMLISPSVRRPNVLRSVRIEVP